MDWAGVVDCQNVFFSPNPPHVGLTIIRLHAAYDRKYFHLRQQAPNTSVSSTPAAREFVSPTFGPNTLAGR